MSAAAVAVGSYYGTTDDNTDLYIAPGGGFADENGVPLALPSGTDINLSNGASLTYGGGPVPAPAPSPPPATTPVAQDASIFSGIADIFGATGTAIGKTLGALSPPKPTTLPGQVGAYVYNPQTGQYVPAVQGATSASNMGVIVLIGVLAVALIVMAK